MLNEDKKKSFAEFEADSILIIVEEVRKCLNRSATIKYDDGIKVAEHLDNIECNAKNIKSYYDTSNNFSEKTLKRQAEAFDSELKYDASNGGLRGNYGG